MKRFVGDDDGATSIEAVFVVFSFMLLLLFILFAPHGWLQIQRVARAASTVADIAAREPEWTRKRLEELAEVVAPRLITARTASVTIAVARIVRAAPESPPVATVCIGTVMTDGRTTPLEEGSPLVLDETLLRTGDSIIFVRIAADAEIFTATTSGGIFKETTVRITRSATSRPINGATRYSDAADSKAPKTCTG